MKIPSRPINDAEAKALLQEFANTCGEMTQEKCDAFAAILNNTPRVELGGKTPTQAMMEDMGQSPLPKQSSVRRRRR